MYIFSIKNLSYILHLEFLGYFAEGDCRPVITAKIVYNTYKLGFV